MKKLARYLLLLAAMGLGFAFASCKADDDDDTSQPPVYYTVSFNSNGGTEVKSQTIVHGNKAAKPTNPTKAATEAETYAFENWYTSTDNGTTLSDTAFDFNTPITKDITLYAKWAVNAVTHTVTFNTNGGSTVESQPIIHGNKATRPTDPTKTATAAETYAFDNWYTSTDGGATLSDTAFDFDTAIKGDITLYAKWTVNAVTHTVTFDTKGGSTSPAEQTIVHGKKATKPADPTKTATETETYAFDNWYTSTDGGASLSDTAFDFDTAITKDIILYAKWTATAITHTVTFNTNGGSTAPAEQTIVHGKKATRPTDPTKEETATEAFVFDNWYTSTDGGATLSDTAFDFDTAIKGDITLYAKWTVNAVTHTVTFDTKGGSTSPAEQTIVHGNKATKPADPTKPETETEAFAFENWYTSTDGGATLSDTAFDFNSAITKDITLYAKWTVNAVTHTVTFDTNGGSAVESQTIVHGNKATKPADPTKETTTEAFAFDNWYTSTDGGATLSDTAFDFNIVIENDITLYAKWKEADYIILKDCSEIRTMLETLCEYSNYKFQKTITRFAKADARPEAAENYIDAAGNRIPLWYDEAETTLYYYLEPGKKMSLRTSDGKNRLFYYMTDATSIETKDFDTSNVTNMSDMFRNCSKLTALDVSNFDTSNVTNMSYMFRNCSNLTALDVSNFDTSKVTNMSYMFGSCTKLTALDLSKFDTSKVTNMWSMFSSCIKLTALDVSKFDTSNVTNMSYMFYDCSYLTALDVSNFDTSKVTYMSDMFYYCSKLTALDVSKFDTSKVTDMSDMFRNCSKLTALDLSNFDTSKVTYMGYMFQKCSELTTIFVSDKFVTNGVTSDYDMFKDCAKLKGGAGTVYDAAHINKEYARIDGGTDAPGYFTAKTN